MNVWLRRIGGYAIATAVLLVGWELLSLAVGSQALPGPVPALSCPALHASPPAGHRLCLKLTRGPTYGFDTPARPSIYEFTSI